MFHCSAISLNLLIALLTVAAAVVLRKVKREQVMKVRQHNINKIMFDAHTHTHTPDIIMWRISVYNIVCENPILPYSTTHTVDPILTYLGTHAPPAMTFLHLLQFQMPTHDLFIDFCNTRAQHSHVTNNLSHHNWRRDQ